MTHDYEMRRVRRNARAQVRALAHRLGLPAPWQIVPEPEPVTVDEAMADLRETLDRVAEPIRRVNAAFRDLSLTAAEVNAHLQRITEGAR